MSTLQFVGFHIQILQDLVGTTGKNTACTALPVSVDRTQEYGRRVSFLSEVDGSSQDF